jgi:hypothetical protein
MLMDALDSWLKAKEQEEKLKAKGMGSPNDMMNVDPQLQQVRATLGDGGATDFMSHLGTTLGARMLGKTGLDKLGVGSGSQAMQNALAYQQMRPDMLKAGSVNPAGLNSALNVQQKSGDDGKSLLKMIAKMMMAG